ncbi:kinase [Luteibacter aegosomatissinici]|uniref:kinase n=1 Tax=Luteibacter aegosomatissinici TaxID=2911539 RepID=UPI001FFBB971|nr:kinase [Luteibacter aegosomatissinici]UPG95657.1 kinase [Luteibacter aegosomatissinici]
MESNDASTLAEAVLGRFAAAIAQAAQPFILGISGLQGSGKSTLGAGLIAAAGRRGWGAVTVSLDDVYLTHAERLALSDAVHPLLRTRGVPGTHDLPLLASTLDALGKASPERPVAVPRFEKGRDDRYDEALWPTEAEVPRLVVLEGWCLGVEPQDGAALVEPVNALERDEDPDGTWRRWVNAQLAGYLPLWRRIDALVVLAAPSWDVVARWRGEAEEPLRARGEPRAMDTAALARFLQHYERLSRHALATLPAKADLLIPLAADRTPALHAPWSTLR